jgi:hypothetical protein
MNAMSATTIYAYNIMTKKNYNKTETCIQIIIKA